MYLNSEFEQTSSGPYVAGEFDGHKRADKLSTNRSDEIDFEVHSINSRKEVKNDLKGQNMSYFVKDERLSKTEELQYPMTSTGLEIDGILEKTYRDEFVARPLSAGTTSSRKQHSIPIYNRPSSAKITKTAPNSSRKKNAQTEESYLRKKLALPRKISSVPLPEQFPITSTRSTHNLLGKEASPKLRRKNIVRAYLSDANKQMKLRKIPEKFYKDPEGMYMDLQDLKHELVEVKKENNKLKTQLRKTEAEHTRKQKQVEELLRAHAIVENKGSYYENLFKEVTLVKKLKEKIRELENMLAEKDEEFERIKIDSRYTRIRELETELKAYYTESRRLVHIIEQTRSMQENYDNILNELNRTKLENAKLRELVISMKKVQDYQQEQISRININGEQLSDNNKSYNVLFENDSLKKQVVELETLVKQLRQGYNPSKNEIERIASSNYAHDKVTLDGEFLAEKVLEKVLNSHPDSVFENNNKMKENEQATEIKNDKGSFLASQFKEVKSSLDKTFTSMDSKVELEEKLFEFKEKEAIIEESIHIIGNLKNLLEEKEEEVARLNQIIEKNKLDMESLKEHDNALSLVTKDEVAENDELELNEFEYGNEEIEDLEEEEVQPKRTAKRNFSFDIEDDEASKHNKARVPTYDEAANIIIRSWKKFKTRKSHKEGKPLPTKARNSKEGGSREDTIEEDFHIEENKEIAEDSLPQEEDKGLEETITENEELMQENEEDYDFHQQDNRIDEFMDPYSGVDDNYRYKSESFDEEYEQPADIYDNEEEQYDEYQ